MTPDLAVKLGPHIIEGMALWEEVKTLGVDIDDQTEFPTAVHVVMPERPSERAEEIFKDPVLSERLAMFLSARHGTYNICYHGPNCSCGYRRSGGGFIA